MKRIATFFRINHDAFQLLRRTEPLILASSTAFFSTFALSPILVLLVNLFGLYFASDRINSRLYSKIGSMVGPQAAREIESIVNNFMEVERTWWLTAGGLVLFFFIATTLLVVVKQNIHKLWRIRRAAARIRDTFQERMNLFAIILVTGVLFLISGLIDSSLAISLDYLQTFVPTLGIVFIQFLNLLFSLVVVTFWFTILFKLLPDAKVDWDVAFAGALLTAIMFNTGKFFLGKILVHARIASIFGASASFALLLLFIFYSAFILYYGAAFTHEYAEYLQRRICAGRHCIEYEEKIVESRYS